MPLSHYAEEKSSCVRAEAGLVCVSVQKENFINFKENNFKILGQAEGENGHLLSGGTY